MAARVMAAVLLARQHLQGAADYAITILGRNGYFLPI